MRKIIVLLAATSVFGCSGNAARAAACSDVDVDGKQALHYLIDFNYELGLVRSEDPEEITWGKREILEQGADLLPCLVDIYHHGLQNNVELWPVDDAAVPSQGRWALELIREIDAGVGMELYREQLSELDKDASVLDRIKLSAEVAVLGDAKPLPGLVAFLERSPNTDSTEDAYVATWVQERALKAISVHHYKPALPVLEKLKIAKSREGLLKVVKAQLAEDALVLEEYVKDSRLTSAALFALKRIGRDEIVKGIAADPRNPARFAAESVLSGKREP